MKIVTTVLTLTGMLVSSALADTIFDNSQSDINTRFNPGTFEVGDQIVLAGTARYLTNFSFEYWGTNSSAAGNPAFSGDVQARIRFYKNDGPVFNGYATPGTCFWASDWFAISPTERNILVFTPGADFPADGVYLPSTEMTWSVQFRGMEETDVAGIDFYSPAVTGADYPDYWQRPNQKSSWTLMTNTVPTDFAAKMQATTLPESGSPFVAINRLPANQALVYWPGWATNYVLEAGSALGTWNAVSTGITWKDNNWELTTPVTAGGAEFYRLHKPQ